MHLSIIGGSGFVGTRLSKRLKTQGIDFTIIDKVPSDDYPESTSICDIRNANETISIVNNTDIIINLAAEHRDDVKPVSLYDEVNVQGAQNICEAAERNGIKTIIFTSSVAVYGESEGVTDENGDFNYFNNYGRTKKEAEDVYIDWQKREPSIRKLVIVRPTVIFGEKNRGNVYNLLKQMATGKFLMIGNGKNRKSMAYVENIAAFLEYSIENFSSGISIINYADKPDYDMNSLVLKVKESLGKRKSVGIRIPYSVGFLGGICFDILSKLTGKNFPISSIRVKKFCMNTTFTSNIISETGFVPPVELNEAFEKTIKYEFMRT